MSIADSNKTFPVMLAGRDFVLRVVPMSRVKRLGVVVTKILSEVSAVDTSNPTEMVTSTLTQLLEFPYELLNLFINDLPKDIFDDEENGVTFPEFWGVLMKAIEINRIDVLKNVLARLGPLMQARQ